MKFTDIFIRRPVLAVSISLLIVILGLQSFSKLSIKEYPSMTVSMVSVSTSYSGASASLMQSFVTSILEGAIAQADNIDYMTSSSSTGSSKIKVKMLLNTDPDLALANISSKVNSVRKKLPSAVDDPTVSVSSGDDNSVMEISFHSDNLHISQVNDYIQRVVTPELYTVPGVADVSTYGGSVYGIRIWLDPDKMAAYNLSASTVMTALTNNNIQAAAGNANGFYTYYKNNIQTTSTDVKGIENLTIFNNGNQVVHLKDIAIVALDKAQDSYRSSSNGQSSISISISTSPTANPLTVAKAIYPIYQQLKDNAPPGIDSDILYDKSKAISNSIDEVIHTIFEAGLIVLVVITLFIGSFRAVLIPVITIPISLIGVIMLLQAFGFSINLMTLLGLVLAIGLVVDDAIVVLENIDRIIKSGETPFRAAIQGAREIAIPVISMTIALCAVYSPMAIIGGITGALFKEFALTLAGAVFISGIIALTLSPMMSSKLLKHNEQPSKFEQKINRGFDQFATGYSKLLTVLLNNRAPVIIFALFIFASIPLTFKYLPTELTPTEDKGLLRLTGKGPSNTNLDYVENAAKPFEQKVLSIPEIAFTQVIAGKSNLNEASMKIVLKDWHNRSRNQDAIQKEVNNIGKNYTPLSFSAYAMPEINTGDSGPPVGIVLKTSNSYEELATTADDFIAKAKASGMFSSINSDLSFTTPRADIKIDKDKAGMYGVTMADITRTVGAFLSGSTTSRIDINGQIYDVIAQVERIRRLKPADLDNFNVVNNQGQSIPLSSFIKITMQAEPKSLPHWSQMRSVTISAVPNVSIGTATEYLKQLTNDLPAGYSYDFSGQSRQYIQQGSTMLLAFALSVIIIYLVLAIQFESWRDPFIIIVSVPLAVSGALVSLVLLNYLGIKAATLNIYSQMGLITLVGLITKHGILICEVAKEQQLHFGKNKIDAVVTAGKMRLRPILMTTSAMIAGLIPLLYAQGSGSNSRFSIGVVIVAGLSIGTLFTLFILPVVYSLLAKKHKPLPIYDE